MKFNKIKLGIATLAAFATFLGFATGTKAADSTPAKHYGNSVSASFEAGSDNKYDSDVDSTKETIDLRIRKEDLAYNITGSHADYSGTLEGKKIKENTNLIRLGVEKKIDKKLFLSPYIEIKDDIDPLREFSNKDVSSFSLGILGECLLKKPFTLIGDIRGSDLSNGDTDFLVSLGLMYYFNDDWISIRGVNWKESLRDVNTAMASLFFRHKFNDRFKLALHGGYGKEYGARRERVSDVGAKLSYDINKKLTLDLGYNNYKSKSEKNIYGIGLTWGF